VRDVAWQGHPLPIGAGVGLSLWHLHRDPGLWREPTRVVPQRWLDRGGPWGAPREPFAFLPFGHGGRYCIGAGLARTVTLAFAWAALRTARWTTSDADVRPVGMTLVPAGGLPLAWRSG
jgi:cytochrome P450